MQRAQRNYDREEGLAMVEKSILKKREETTEDEDEVTDVREGKRRASAGKQIRFKEKKTTFCGVGIPSFSLGNP